MGNQMIDWRELLFWQNTDMDTAGCLSEGMAEWYMSIVAQNKAKTAPFLQGDTVTLTSICVRLLPKHVKHVQRPFCLATVDRIHTFVLLLLWKDLYGEVKG